MYLTLNFEINSLISDVNQVRKKAFLSMKEVAFQFKINYDQCLFSRVSPDNLKKVFVELQLLLIIIHNNFLLPW